MKKILWLGSSREDLRGFSREARREMGSGIIRNFPLHLSGDAAGGSLCLALLPKEDTEDEPAGFGLGGEAI